MPDDVALLWGRRGGPRRGPRPSLSVADITRAAVAVADADGLDAVSMARVAAELGNSTMALYRHVRSKDELLALMTDAAMESPPEREPDGDWRAGLYAWAHGVVAVSRRHPWFARLPVGGPPIGPHNLAWLDRGLAELEPVGLPPDEAVAIVTGLLIYTQGGIRLGAELAVGYAADPDAFGARYGRLLGALVDPHRMPALARAVAAGVFDGTGTASPPPEHDATAGAEFELGLTFLLDGIAAHIARRGTPGP
ncbi:TetR/AcrR family transcriptional regulator C-terminal domain-containing protein [Pseudonocardia sp. KRD-291]|nr:TetR/AcrR family transcriptional regulator C-terminal domain-containing protein [Pseudonocardia sp. KRD291]